MKKSGFTLVELLVVIAIIAVLMAILMPALNRVRRQARAAACMAHLKQWGLMFTMYCDDNDGYFFSGQYEGNWEGNGNFWRKCMKPYSKNEKMWLCPNATLHRGTNKISPWAFQAWKAPNGDLGSYGPNGWILNPPPGTSDVYGRTPISDHWRRPDVRGSNNIPVFLGSMWVDAWPKDTDVPSDYEDWRFDRVNDNEMRRFCIDRHDGFVNGLFADWTVRKVGLKELWTLKWSRSFKTNCRTGPGIDWKWLSHYKDY